MKPTLVDNCEHYNYQTHNCNKCGRGLPDVCLEFENMRKAAAAYEKQQNIKGSDGTVSPPDDADDDTVASVAPAVVPKPRGRQKRVAQ